MKRIVIYTLLALFVINVLVAMVLFPPVRVDDVGVEYVFLGGEGTVDIAVLLWQMFVFLATVGVGIFSVKIVNES